MVSLQLSGIAASMGNGNPALAGALTPPAAPNLSGRAVPTGPLNRGAPATDAAAGAPESGTDTAAPLAPKAPSSAPTPGADTSEAIGTQMVLVFDDQTRSMTVKILDIFTQKIEQPAPLPLGTTAAQGTMSGQGGSGSLVDTKA